MEPAVAPWVYRTPRGLRVDARGGRRARVPATRWLELLWVFARNDFLARYRSRSLGLAWSFLHPSS